MVGALLLDQLDGRGMGEGRSLRKEHEHSSLYPSGVSWLPTLQFPDMRSMVPNYQVQSLVKRKPEDG